MRLFMIFIALVIAFAAGAAFYLVNASSESETSVVTTPQDVQVAQVQEQTILVARRDIPVGKRLDANDIDRQVWPAHLIHEDFILDGSEGEVVDQVARTAFRANQPLVRSFIANKDDPGFLAAQLASGMRAVTIPIDDISGVNGFIFPGDRVDVLVKHRVHLEEDYKDATDIAAAGQTDAALRDRPTSVQHLPRESSYKVPLLMNTGKAQGRPGMDVTETLLNNVRVLAVGTVSTQYEGATATPRNITLEVTDLQAQKIRHADSGSLTLTLRSLEDAGNFALTRPVADADMSSLVPPAYFPYLYSRGDYATEVLDLEEVDYSAAPESRSSAGSEERNHIVIIRGVQKETVGVDRQ